MFLKALSIACCSFLIACSLVKNTSQPTQTVEGYIYRLSGNQMPGPGRKTGGKGKGVIREIRVYEPTTAAQAQGSLPLFTKVNTKLVATAHSDSTGHYKLKLPAGKYSVFIKEATGLFAAQTDGEGCLNPIEITKGQPLKKDFTITLNAVF